MIPVRKICWRRDRLPTPVFLGFLCGSTDKESTCNTGDPGSGRSAGEGIGYPLQYSWASLEAQLVKNLPAIWETWVRSLGWEDPLEKGTAAHSSILAWKIPWGRKELDMAARLSLFTFMHWSRKWQPTPVFLPGESQRRGSLVGCRLWGCTESDTTKVT